MNVLILHQHFRTPQEGGALRSYFLAKALVDRGHSVQVVTGSTLGTQTVKMIEGIEVHHMAVSYSSYFGFWKRIYSFLRFVIVVCWKPKPFVTANLCYAISVPLTVGLIARWLRWRHNIPYVFEVGDLWPDAPIELGVIQNTFLKNSLRRVEKVIYSHAECIVALSPSIRDVIAQKIPTKKIHVIPNMADTVFFKSEPKQPVLENKFGVIDKLVICYFGAMGFANGLDYILSCAQGCEKSQLAVHFLLAGDGVERENLKHRASQLNLKNLTFVEFQSREGIRELLNVTDAIFVCYRHAKILETGSPNKFFDGLAAGKLIIINFAGWIRNEIEDAGCGFYVDPENPYSIVKPLQDILQNGLLRQYQGKSRELAEQKFSRKNLTEEWIKIVEAYRP